MACASPMRAPSAATSFAPSAEPAPQAPEAPGAQPTEVLTVTEAPAADVPAYAAEVPAPGYGAAGAAPT